MFVSAKVVGEVVEGSAGVAGDVVGEPFDHSIRCAARSTVAVMDEDIGEVVPVLRGSPSVRSVALGEDVPGQPGNTQLDVDVVPQARSGERAELPVACGEAGTRW